MKILYLHQYFNTPSMSSGTRSYEMARRFVASGHEVHMITSWRRETDHKSWFETEEAGIRVHWLPVPYSNRMSYRERIKAFGSFAASAGRRAHMIGGDVVFATSTPLTIALPGVYASRRLRVPMVFEVRDLWPELPIAIGALKNPVLRKLAHGLERFAYRNSERIVALSPGMRDGVVQTGYPEDQVAVIPNSCDVSTFRGSEVRAERFLQKHPQLQGKQIVLYGGTLGLINGVGYLVDIAAAMRDINPQIHFLIVGGGHEDEVVRSKAEQAEVLHHNLSMLPRIPKKDMPDVLAAASLATSLFIDLPEMWHNSANKFFDGLAAGKPVLINYEGWQAELIRENGVGVVVPPGRPAAAARMIAEFLDDPKRVRTAGAGAARLANDEFHRDLLAARLLRVLEDVVNPSPPAA